jgi:hypothetical protein
MEVPKVRRITRRRPHHKRWHVTLPPWKLFARVIWDPMSNREIAMYCFDDLSEMDAELSAFEEQPYLDCLLVKQHPFIRHYPGLTFNESVLGQPAEGRPGRNRKALTHSEFISQVQVQGFIVSASVTQSFLVT